MSPPPAPVIKGQEKPAHREFMAEPESLGYVPEPAPRSLELQCRAVEEGLTWSQEALSIEASVSSRGPRKEVQAAVTAEAPGTPPLCLLATAGLPREGTPARPWSLEEPGEGREEGLAEGPQAVSAGAAAGAVPKLPSPSGHPTELLWVHKGAPE